MIAIFMDLIRRAAIYLFDRRAGLPNHLMARWLFLRALGLIYLSAFSAFLLQARGLIGSDGILPAAAYLSRLHPLGNLRFWYAPTLLWLSSSNAALMTLCWAGVLASLLVIANLMPRAALLVCFLSLLSILSVAQDFGQYQSDGMILEAGFLSIFIAPPGVRPHLGQSSLPVRAAWFLLLWEWFRIYFESGMVKLLSGDPTWRNLTAMYEYYQNGPLPTWIAWYLQHLPNWFHIATAGLTLLMEIVLVWMAFLPGRWRVVCFCMVTAWQIGVIATANYAFLNYLVLILAFLLLNDRALGHVLEWALVSRWTQGVLIQDSGSLTSNSESPLIVQSGAVPFAARFWPLRIAVTAVVLSWIGYATTAELVAMVWRTSPLPAFPVTALEPFRIANEYGLFANMTPHRYEIEFQGSNDGQTWSAYSFRFKPQNVWERPGIYGALPAAL